MANNRNPEDPSTEQPRSAESEDQDRPAPEQDSLGAPRRSDKEGTTTNPWIRNKII